MTAGIEERHQVLRQRRRCSAVVRGMCMEVDGKEGVDSKRKGG